MPYALINKSGDCSTVRVPSSAGIFSIIPVFLTRLDALVCRKAIEPSERQDYRVVKVFARIILE